MGYLVHIALALLVTAVAEEGVASRTELPLVVIGLAAVPYVLAALTRRSSLRGRFGRAARLLVALNASAPLLHAVAVLGCGWYQILERLVGTDARLFGWPRPASLLALAPFVVYGLLSIDARARALHRDGEGVARAWRFQGRMLLSALAPLVLYVLIAWGVGASSELRARIDHVQVWGALFAASLVVLFLALLPFLLEWTWETGPMPIGPLRGLLEALARKAGFRCRQILVWHTESQVANAAVVGISPKLRVVLLSDALLSQLHPAETLAVFAHEIGHARRHHVLVFIAWSAAFFMGADLLVARWLPEGALPASAALLVGLGLWYAGFGWLSRRFELDADLYSAELLGDGAPMIGALEAVGGPHGRGRSSWRHFSTSDRIDFLRHLSTEPEHGRRLRRRLRALAWAGGVLAGLGLTGEVLGIASSYPAESVTAELALGHYDLALERLAGVREPEERLARLTTLAAGLSTDPDRLTPEALVVQARDVLARGSLIRALDLLELAQLRGDPDAAALAPMLADLPGSDDPLALERAILDLQADHPEWAEALQRGARASRD